MEHLRGRAGQGRAGFFTLADVKRRDFSADDTTAAEDYRRCEIERDERRFRLMTSRRVSFPGFRSMKSSPSGCIAPKLLTASAYESLRK
jgi:hypothetical protein